MSSCSPSSSWYRIIKSHVLSRFDLDLSLSIYPSFHLSIYPPTTPSRSNDEMTTTTANRISPPIMFNPPPSVTWWWIFGLLFSIERYISIRRVIVVCTEKLRCFVRRYVWTTIDTWFICTSEIVLRPRNIIIIITLTIVIISAEKRNQLSSYCSRPDKTQSLINTYGHHHFSREDHRNLSISSRRDDDN